MCTPALWELWLHIHGMRHLLILSSSFILIDMYIGPTTVVVPPNTWPAMLLHIYISFALYHWLFLLSLTELLILYNVCVYIYTSSIQVTGIISYYIISVFLPSHLNLHGTLRYTNLYYVSSLHIKHRDSPVVVVLIFMDLSLFFWISVMRLSYQVIIVLLWHFLGLFCFRICTFLMR